MNELQERLAGFEWFEHKEYLIFNDRLELVQETNDTWEAFNSFSGGHIIVTFDEHGKPHRLLRD